MIRLYRIDPAGASRVTLPEPSSLDAITRQLPEGYYSTFRTFAGCRRVLGLTSHLRRLPEVDASALRRQLLQLLEPYRSEEARVRVMQTTQGQVYIALEPLKTLPPEVYQQGVRVGTSSVQRDTPRLKTTAFIDASDRERKHIAQIGLFEALLTKNGRILEGLTSNFFYMIHTVLYTARKDILLGVTRRIVIRVARDRGWEVRYRPLKLDQLPAVTEAFITSSSRGIVPVIQIDEALISNGEVGASTRRLLSAYERYVVRHAEKI